MNIPLHSLAGDGPGDAEALEAIFESVVLRRGYTTGERVASFEQDFADACGSRLAVGVASGTDAIRLALEALGIGPGDEVITAPTTFFSTAEAIARCGATVVFADVDPASGNLCPEAFARAVTARTRAVVPVHLHGTPCDMEAIVATAMPHGIAVVEDAAQAHGAECGGRRVGSIGRLGCFSFHPTKILGAIGAAGAVVTDDPELAGRMQMLRDHGRDGRDRHCRLGWNARMDDLQAAVLHWRLAKLEQIIRRRRRNARRLRAELAALDLRFPPEDRPGARAVPYVFAVGVSRRAEVIEALRAAEVDCAVHYPVPLHLQPAFAMLGHQPGDFPAAERFCAETLSLPVHQGLDPAAGRAIAVALAPILDPTGPEQVEKVAISNGL